MTPISQRATILYRLVGATVARKKSQKVIAWGLEWEELPMEMLPIPFDLTDFGRAYLADMRARESEAARAVLSAR